VFIVDIPFTKVNYQNITMTKALEIAQVPSIFDANTTAISFTGTVNAASHTIGSTLVANTLGVYHTGTINAASHTIGSALVANTLGVYHTGTVNAASFTTSGFSANTTVATATTAANTASNTVIATTEFVKNILQEYVYPVGSIYTNASNATNPATLLGFGVWVAFGQGRVAIGAGTGGGSTYTAGGTGGSKDAIVVSHTHTATSVVTDPGHFHSQEAYNQPGIGNAGGGGARVSAVSKNTANNTTGITVATTVDSNGSSGTDANMQPYVVVYMWQRSA
jgi:hypothetical protein